MFMTIPYLDKFREYLSGQPLDDAIDRLSYIVTACLMLFFAFMVGTKQNFGQPIKCLNPHQYTATWNDYVDNLCFIKGTYTHEMQIQLSQFHKEGPRIAYYPWVPYWLSFMAILFLMPNWVWASLQRQSGTDLQTVVTNATELRSMYGAKREEKLSELTAFIEQCLGCRKERQQRSLCCRLFYGGRLGVHISALYLFIKALYVINAIVQFVLLNRFLGTGYSNLWGFEILSNWYRGEEVNNISALFPLTTMCDYVRLEVGQARNISVQCVLMINLLNEKIFMFLWFWILFVVIMTVFSLVYNMIIILPGCVRMRHAERYLSVNWDVETERINGLERFVHNVLQADGFLLFCFIETHAGSIIAQELTERLYSNFVERTKESKTRLCLPSLINGNDTWKMASTLASDDGFFEKLSDSHPVTACPVSFVLQTGTYGTKPNVLHDHI